MSFSFDKEFKAHKEEDQTGPCGHSHEPQPGELESGNLVINALSKHGQEYGVVSMLALLSAINSGTKDWIRDNFNRGQ